MHRLSVSRINESSPYVVRLESDCTACFSTDGGVVYEVGFVEDYTIAESGVYQFFIKNVNGRHSFSDDKLSGTIISIVREFFAACFIEFMNGLADKVDEL